MTFVEACVQAAEKSKKYETIIYVYYSSESWVIGPAYKKGWLFKAYPGGRKVLSMDGKTLLSMESLKDQ